MSRGSARSPRACRRRSIGAAAPGGAAAVVACAGALLLAARGILPPATLAGTTTSDGGSPASAAPAIVRGSVWHDRNGNGVHGPTEPGVPGAWIGVISVSTRSVLGFTHSDRRGTYVLEIPAHRAATEPVTIACVPAAGHYPTTTTARRYGPLAPGDVVDGQDFGLGVFRRMRLLADGVLSLGTGTAVDDGRPGGAELRGRADPDLFAGARVWGGGRVSVWFNRFQANPVFGTTRDEARRAPDAVLAMGIDALVATGGPGRGSDLVIGTPRCEAGNFFVWLGQSVRRGEGRLPARHSQACRTADDGSVQAIVTGDVAGGPGVDILVGTGSPSPGRGTIEVWRNDDRAAPRFERAQVLSGETLSAPIGEVTCMALAYPEVSRTGARRGSEGPTLVVGTRAGAMTGQLMVFDRSGPSGTFALRWTRTWPRGAITCLAYADVTGDGWLDIVVGVQRGAASGQIELWAADPAHSAPAFRRLGRAGVPGIPASMVAGDFGGAPGADVAVGYRSRAGGSAGGLRIYYCDAGTLPPGATDPSAGAATGWVPALVAADFDFGRPAVTPRPRERMDLAAGLAEGAGAGTLLVLVR